MGLISKHHAELRRNHPALLHSSVSGTPAEIFWLDPGGERGLALTAREALELLPALLADAVALRMGHPDAAGVQSDLEQVIWTQLGTQLRSRLAFPSHHFPDDALEQAPRVSVGGYELDLGDFAARATSAVSWDEAHPALTAQLGSTALQAVAYARRALAFVRARGSLDVALQPLLNGPGPQDLTTRLPGPCDPPAVLADLARAAAAYQTGLEASGHGALVHSALRALLLAADLDPAVFVQPRDDHPDMTVNGPARRGS